MTHDAYTASFVTGYFSTGWESGKRSKERTLPIISEKIYGKRCAVWEVEKMTFFDISRKMLKAGFYKYRLYFLCNLSATALFCCFAVISKNRTFMNASIVNSSISNNIYLPFFLSAVFLFFFPVSCQAFLASRKQNTANVFS